MARKNVSVSLPADMFRFIDRESRRRGTTRADVVRTAIVSYFADHKAIAEGLKGVREVRVTPAFRSMAEFNAYRRTRASPSVAASQKIR